MDSSTSAQDVHFDLLCIGFGATALSVAIALHEKRAIDNTIFLERQPESTWRSCSGSPSGRLRTSFLHDLVTSESPRSKFTFMNYLHATNRLVLYANGSQINPPRDMFNDYLQWCAGPFQQRVRFGKRVAAVHPVQNAQGLVECFKVVYTDSATGQQDVVTAKQVISAVGLQPSIPRDLAKIGTLVGVAHASDCLSRISSTLRTTSGRARFAIIGDGQAAGEIFEYLHGVRGEHQVVWFTQDPVLREMDDSPFVMDNTKRPESKIGQTLPLELRRRAIGEGHSAQTSSAIDRHLLKSIYDIQYTESVKCIDTTKWKCQIRFQHRLTKAEKTANGQIQLSCQPIEYDDDKQVIDVFDLVIAATGYERTEYKKIMEPLLQLLDGRQITVNQDYQVNFRSGSFGARCGLWLLGAIEGEDVSARLPLAVSH
ncbi:L-ornithine N(5)-monooxygenase [Exophiala dermatitidis]